MASDDDNWGHINNFLPFLIKYFLFFKLISKFSVLRKTRISGSLWHIHSCCCHHGIHGLYANATSLLYYTYGAIFCFLRCCCHAWIFNDRWENLDLPTTRSSSAWSLTCTWGWCKRYKMVQLMVKEVVSLPATNKSNKTISKLCKPWFPWKLGWSRVSSFSISFK